ncbi:uncharacterized protein N7483_009577 [Penicillium malachiteum]|uniref:uncharacterized protein n=1 Tax=Penicillium malachiteum TaxID=1324776 RepID=UPI002546B9A8|nr:uncharacterized protein N7483_009577 [Penicillium malachiteum]KAJ5721643.1 hypothetical protein N7483_009577 [Penicillium malachiteum]
MQTTGSNPLESNVSSSLDLLTLDMRDLVRRVQQLAHLGIEDNRIALPKICVVGDQSTGKSSLIEAISEIKVPRSADTCTRCPMEIVLRESEPDQQWKCVVSLVQGYYYDPQKQLKSKGPEKSEYLGPWLRKSSQDDYKFITLTDKGEVQDVIWRAQFAILNPTTDSQDFLPPRDIQFAEKEVKFSPNVIRLDISGPDLPNLSFYDLPGVINQADNDREKYVVGLIQKLVRQYVSQQNCIVLTTQSMTDDASNSSAGRLVRDVHGAKERTLGVMTKPDRLETTQSNYHQWLEMLEGKKFEFGLGWYIVKNNPDPNVDHVTARQEEEIFFADPFWSGVMASHQERFGVRKLVTTLSHFLRLQIQKCLPSIIKQIDEKAIRIENELKSLPDPPLVNHSFVLIDKVVKLGQQFNCLFSDGYESALLQKPWNDLVLDFKKALDTTKPLIVLSAPLDQNPRGVKRKAPASENSIKTQPGTSQSAPEKRVYLTDSFDGLESPKRFTLDHIQNLKQECQHAGVPNQIDPRAIQKLNQSMISHWEVVVKSFAQALHGVLEKAVLSALNDVMSMYRQTGLYREFQKIIHDFLAKVTTDYDQQVLAYFQMEYETPFTMAQAEHKQKTSKVLADLSKARGLARSKVWQKVRGLSDDDKANVHADLGPDPFSQEIEMISSSRGYYEIAAMRFTDMVCLLAESKIRARCRVELKETLEGRFGSTSEERCRELMAEDPEREHRRIDLTKQKARLTQALMWLSAMHKTDEDERTPSDDTMDNGEDLADWDTDTFI